MTFDKFLSILSENLLAPVVLGLIILGGQWLYKKIETKAKKISIGQSSEKDDKIEDVLTEARVTYDADRAYLSLIHNGNVYVDGSEILKISRSHEKAAPGISLEAHLNQAALISLIPDEMLLLNDKKPIFTTTSGLKDGKFKRILESRGIYAVVRCPIINSKDGIIGYIGFDYLNKVDIPTGLDELPRFARIVEEILAQYSKISSLL